MSAGAIFNKAEIVIECSLLFDSCDNKIKSQNNTLVDLGNDHSPSRPCIFANVVLWGLIHACIIYF